LQPLASPAVYQVSVGEYERMVSAGALDDPRIELINGYLVKKMGKNPEHIWTVGAIVQALRATVHAMWCRKGVLKSSYPRQAAFPLSFSLLYTAKS
jgi:hypothetical protein